MNKIKNLCVVIQRYTDEKNQKKIKYKKIGVEITEGKDSYILLDKSINLADFPKFSDYTPYIMVSKFDHTNDENSDEKIYEKTKERFKS